MSKTSVVITVLISAIIGALIGGYIAYSVLDKSIDTEIQARLTQFEGALQSQPSTEMTESQPASATGSSSEFVGSVLDPEELAVTRVYHDVSPSVVHVSTIQYTRNFFFQIVPQEGTGSGFIISEDGYVLTNNHVIAGAHEITVRMSDGTEYDAELVGTDEMTDIAVLRLTDADIPAEWVAKLGDSDSLVVGQRAIAIGNPFGLDSTVTVGVISALDRPVTFEDVSFENMIQTDASINPGNSGGPLIASSGQVIGINTVILSRSGGSHGIGFAIPINAAMRAANDLIEYGRVRRPVLGFSGITLYPALADTLELPVNYGVLVQEVVHGSAAEAAGLHAGTNQVLLRDRMRQFQLSSDGDIIIAFNGEKVTDFNVLAGKIRRKDLGETVTLTVMRGDEQIDLTMTLSE
jgi:S1-C subfamily serine protease